ncbi:SprT-like domain-containing protein (plasmid) [Streptomyces sp. NBC_00377]|uniref:hypothetical protein n=1 Tax=unclassified Streptomyces TaxID=2593676 RepID=UPI002E1DC3E3|nr:MULTISPECIES: hypothetical protein [unclassified Streptomyces]
MATTTATTVEIPAQAEPVEAPAQVDQEHGSRIIAALEGAWAAIRAAHPEVPQVVMITGTGRSTTGVKWGHFGADYWTVEEGAKKGRAPELFAGGELLSLGGRRTMQTLIHEAAHAVAHVRKVKDTSSAGRYHNRRFAKIAEELGLTTPTQPESVRGFSECRITDATADRYTAAINALDIARLPYVYDPLAISLGGGTDRPVGGGTEGEDEGNGEEGQPGSGGTEEPEPVARPAKRPPTRFLVICGCTKPGKDGTPEPARRIQISRATWEFGGEDGGLMCGKCGEPFKKAEQDENEADAG